jgi:hypothetical protein
MKENRREGREIVKLEIYLNEGHMMGGNGLLSGRVSGLRENEQKGRRGMPLFASLLLRGVK